MIPIIHARIHQKIEKHAQSNLVDYSYVKEWVARIVYKKGGIPREDINTTIDDMCKLGLLKKKCRLKYEILKNVERPVKEPLI